ncbi:MAG: 2-amino-4-hydroxy-6-hydroxymethyldihydropteridine diphosphokinase [Sphingobacteriales bacterium]|nr:MAG: 2-amino-4-hydroxy-6-hydroxymethyldihydropteridine diphosphokinase [Sphingobacteriales bacterium]
MHTLFILLGDNKGYRYKHMLLAQYFIQHKIGEIVLSSSIYETAPWQVKHKTKYLNQCLMVKTQLSIFQLLNATQKIEKILGRTNKSQLSSRTIDIDVLFYDNTIVETKNLTIPHPRLHLRKFTLIPLNEIASKIVHPKFNETIQKLLENCDDTSVVEKYSIT